MYRNGPFPKTAFRKERKSILIRIAVVEAIAILIGFLTMLHLGVSYAWIIGAVVFMIWGSLFILSVLNILIKQHQIKPTVTKL
jgi:hypothetical protein